MSAREDHLLEPLFLPRQDLGHQGIGRDTALPAADLGHYAVGAHLVASLLDLHHCPGAMYPPFGALFPDSARAKGVLPERYDLPYQPVLIGVPKDKVNLWQGFQRLRVSLGVAPRCHYECSGVSAACGPQCLAGLAVRHLGHGACVQDVDIGGLAGIHHLVARLGESPGQGLGIGLVQLATVGLDDYSGHISRPKYSSCYYR